jgi:hypothetical protein
MSVFDLREVSPNRWQAKYHGNYGVYTIKIAVDGKNINDFSCTCPSQYFPCKHIQIVKDAINERAVQSVQNSGSGKQDGLKLEDLLKKLSCDKLCDFILKQAKHNPDIATALFLEFSENIEVENGNKYQSLIRRELESINLDKFYHFSHNYEGEIDIDALDLWLHKAEEYLKEKKPDEAILIAQAFIEEFADWISKGDEEEQITDMLKDRYQSPPFEILENAAKTSPIDKQKLYDYCLTEVLKDKYSDADMDIYFHSLLSQLALTLNPQPFIDLQHGLLDKVQDKTFYSAEIILNRLVDFYFKCRDTEKAWLHIEENLQIKSFRIKAVEKRIEQKRFSEAKNLILSCPDRDIDRYKTRWNELLLQIAQEENDIPAMRDISYLFIKDTFYEPYYLIYKSACTTAEWDERFEELFNRYNGEKRFWSIYNFSAPELLAADGKFERLLEYVEMNPSTVILEKYCKLLAALFPKKTLALFRRCVDDYMEKNKGRQCYEYVLLLLEIIETIPGGAMEAENMKKQYMVKYKNRRAMIEILTGKSSRKR